MYPDSNSLDPFHGANPSITDILLGGIGISSFLLPLIFFIFYAYCQYILSKKMEIENSWFAFIPILKWFNQLSIAGKSFLWGVKWLLLPWLIIPGVFITYSILAFMNGIWDISSPSSWMMIFTLMAPFITLISCIVWIIGYVKLNHGISKRTGHGGWWTVWLLFAGFIIFPVTAFHYEKGDNTNPRPLTGWKKALVIIAALIVPLLFLLGIVATALLPALMWAQGRARDTARITQIESIAINLEVYLMDHGSYPAEDSSGCIPLNIFENMPSPTKVLDPSWTKWPGCDGSNGQTYSYKTGTRENGKPYFVIGATTETKQRANSSDSIGDITPETPLIPWNGRYYYKVSN